MYLEYRHDLSLVKYVPSIFAKFSSHESKLKKLL